MIAPPYPHHTSAFAGLGLGLLLLGGCAPAGGTAPAATPPPPAKVAKVAKEADLNTITLQPEAEERLGITTAPVEVKSVGLARSYGGFVVVPPGRSTMQTAPLAGTILPPPGGDAVARPGSVVRRDQPVLAILPILAPEAKANLATLKVNAEGQVAQAKPQLEAAQTAYDRAEHLRTQKLGGSAAAEDARNLLSQAHARLKAAEDNRDIIERTMRDAEGGLLTPLAIKAPADGTLINVHVGAGQAVAAGAALFDVAGLDPIVVRVPVFVGDLKTLARDRDAGVGEMGDAPGAATRPARPVQLGPAADPVAVTVDLFYEVPNKGGDLRPGQRVSVTVPRAVAAEGPTIPASAIYSDVQGGAWVYEKTADHTFVRRRVTVDRVVGPVAVLASGPKPGAPVVTAGVAELYGTEFGFAK